MKDNKKLLKLEKRLERLEFEERVEASKKKKYTAPVYMVIMMSTMLGLSLMFYAMSWAGLSNIFTSGYLIFSGIGLAFYLATVVANIITIKNKQLRIADEFTTALVHKSAFHTLLVMIMMLAVYIPFATMIAGSRGIYDFESTPTEYGHLIGYERSVLQIILAGVIVIELIAFALYTVLIYVYGKKGNLNA